jgi:OOP family OmpA-OmpF porin
MNKLIVVSIILFCSLNSHCQSKYNKWNIGISTGLAGYKGDWGTNFFGPAATMNPLYKIAFGKYLSPFLDVALFTSYNNWSYTTNKKLFDADLINYGTALKLKSNNGFLLPTYSKFAPFISASVSFTTLNSNTLITATYLTIPIGLGFKFRLNEDLDLQLQSIYNYLWSDIYDNKKDESNDRFIHHTIGLNYSFSCKKIDTDLDGVHDNKDLCANTPANVKIDKKGCPIDTDEDGTPDYLDDCINVKGINAAKGCPDLDGDGVIDSKDMCASEAGSIALRGCPDTDFDGIADRDDQCPNEKGSIASRGCPDADGDGVTNNADKCPGNFGLAKFSGCPDIDNDGIQDSDDLCPGVPGTEATKGCPQTVVNSIKTVAQSHTIIASADQDKIQNAKRLIQFEKNEAILLSSSFKSLNLVANILKNNSNYTLSIIGHTDNKGKSEKNIDLSLKRAIAVQNYLIKQGVSIAQLRASGYGDAMPVADNKTLEGRAKNRRVELLLK